MGNIKTPKLATEEIPTKNFQQILSPKISQPSLFHPNSDISTVIYSVKFIYTLISLYLYFVPGVDGEAANVSWAWQVRKRDQRPRAEMTEEHTL